MARLTEQEIELIRRAKFAAREESIDYQEVVAEAERLRAEVLASLLGQAGRSVARTTGLSTLGRVLSRVVVQPARRAILCRHTIAGLRQLDDHLLSDIGLNREEIPYLATRLSMDAIPTAEAAEPGTPGALGRMIRRWRTRHQLEALGDDTLRDIGVARSEIPAVVDNLFSRDEGPRTSTPAEQGVLGAFRRQVRRWRTQRELEALSDHVLADIGIRRSEIPDVVTRLYDQEDSPAESVPARVATISGARISAFAELGLASLPPSVVGRLIKHAA